MPDLAVVIPAYKIEYLDRALSSLAEQTTTGFNVYVGDDCSPYEIAKTCAQYTNRLNITYHRFPSNLGGKDLVSQWHRCVDLMNGEEWLWLFSDDDMADRECVEKFYEALKITGSRYDAYRFNTTVVDQNGLFVSEAEPSPEVENPMSLAYHILHWKRGNSMPDHIFRYSRYVELNGFVNFPFAQASDWASSINFSYPRGLYTIEGPKVRWRQSGKNVSSLASVNRENMILGHIQFLEWVNKKFTEEDEAAFGMTRRQIKAASLFNLRAVIEKHYKGVPYVAFVPVVRKIARIYDYTFVKAALLCLSFNYNVARPKVSATVKRLLLKFLHVRPAR